jgi:two-component system, cell cycle sensor histidine kinase and response regulator CckA
LLTDVVMPEMSGPEVVRPLMSLHPTVKVVYMSGYIGEVLAQYGALGVNAVCLQKPFTPQALLQIVREALDAAPE